MSVWERGPPPTLKPSDSKISTSIPPPSFSSTLPSSNPTPSQQTNGEQAPHKELKLNAPFQPDAQARIFEPSLPSNTFPQMMSQPHHPPPPAHMTSQQFHSPHFDPAAQQAYMSTVRQLYLQHLQRPAAGGFPFAQPNSFVPPNMLFSSLPRQPPPNLPPQLIHPFVLPPPPIQPPMPVQLQVPSVQPAPFDASTLPPDDLLFAPFSHAQFRAQWEDLVLNELDASVADADHPITDGEVEARRSAMKADREGIRIECYNPLEKESQRIMRIDADFAYLPIHQLSVEPEELSDIEPYPSPAKTEDFDPSFDVKESEQDDDDATDQEEIDVALRYQNPLIDTVAVLSPGNAVDMTRTTFPSPAPFSSPPPDDDGAELILASPVASRDEESDRTSDFWQLPHPPRRVFKIHNSHESPVVLSLSWLKSTSSPTSPFEMFGINGQRINPRTRLMIEPESFCEIVVQASSSTPWTELGLFTSHVLFQIEFPALWARSFGKRNGLANSLLNFEVKHCVIVRAVKAMFTDASAAKILSRESKPYYPAGIRRVFDEPVHHQLVASLPPLPPSFMRLKAGIDAFELPSDLLWLNAARLDLLEPAHAADVRCRFDAAWQAHVTDLKEYWTSVPGFVSSTESPANLSAHAKLRSHLFNLQVGLHAEELQQLIDVRSYDLFYVRLNHSRNRLQAHVDADGNEVEFVLLKVPGVAERRPAVAIGEPVEFRVADQPQATSLSVIAYVSGVREDQVLLSFPKAAVAQRLKLKHVNEVTRVLYHVRFSVDRLPMRYMYRALMMLPQSENSMRFLFPSTLAHNPRRETLPTLEPFDQCLNFEQLSAVQHVIARSSNTRPLEPFLLFGPPGTGKSSTVVEAALQLLHFNPPPQSAYDKDHIRLLLVAPSNYAADVLVERLSTHVSEQEMIRLNSYQRHTSVKPMIQKYLYMDPDTPWMYGFPPVEDLLKFRIVVCTCAQVGCFLDAGVPVGSFSHILFDESAQALEAETLIPLSIAGPMTQVLLAGDHKQLGPEVHSTVAQSMGLKVSLQERLLNSELYQHSLQIPLHSSTSSSECCAIQLTKNYRSHANLLAISSSLFYQGSLQPYADPTIVNSLTHWEGLPNRTNFPLLFYGVAGEDVYEQEYSSFYNPFEAAQIVQLIVALLKSKQIPDLSTRDIGVIAPYRKQVLILRTLLRARNLGSIRVGSVDDFQGEEATVIFISTVVSRMRNKVFGTESNGANQDSGSEATLPLGILRNAQRFNVAVSRAKALTCVVGNPNLLMHENNWRELLMYAIENGAYLGAAIPALQKQIESKKLLGGGVDANQPVVQMAVRAFTSQSSEDVALFEYEDLEEVDPADITMLDSSHFFDGSWRVML